MRTRAPVGCRRTDRVPLAAFSGATRRLRALAALALFGCPKEPTPAADPVHSASCRVVDLDLSEREPQSSEGRRLPSECRVEGSLASGALTIHEPLLSQVSLAGVRSPWRINTRRSDPGARGDAAGGHWVVVEFRDERDGLLQWSAAPETERLVKQTRDADRWKECVKYGNVLFDDADPTARVFCDASGNRFLVQARWVPGRSVQLDAWVSTIQLPTERGCYRARKHVEDIPLHAEDEFTVVRLRLAPPQACEQ